LEYADCLGSQASEFHQESSPSSQNPTLAEFSKISARPNELNITSQDGDTSRTDRPQKAITEEAEPPLQKQVNSQEGISSAGSLLPTISSDH
jgi:hypothetical protein